MGLCYPHELYAPGVPVPWRPESIGSLELELPVVVNYLKTEPHMAQTALELTTLKKDFTFLILQLHLPRAGVANTCHGDLV